MTNPDKNSDASALSRRELVLLRRAAEDAIHAANPRYGPFIDAVANPLTMLALVSMAERCLGCEAEGHSIQNSNRKAQ